jgi:hypothetical protein
VKRLSLTPIVVASIKATDTTEPTAMKRPNPQATAEPRESRQTSRHWMKTLATTPQFEEKLGLLSGSRATRSSNAQSPA